MVLKSPFWCPTKIFSDAEFSITAAEILAGRRYTIVTSQGWIKRETLAKLMHQAGIAEQIIGDVDPNPRESSLASIAERLGNAEVVVALGGGSVIDAAKGAIALKALEGRWESLSSHLRRGEPLAMGTAPLPLLAIPTTSGTGSEVTPWGTIWGDDAVKFSVNDNRLFPIAAILDPRLCVTMPSEVTLASGLDALSHAMEAVWNRRHTPATDALAASAISLLRVALGPVLRNGRAVELRRDVQTASLLAGLAMSTTQTALAHSISYPFTSRLGMPHGLACSFSLAEVSRFNLQQEPLRLAPIAVGLGCRTAEIPDALYGWFDELGVGLAVGRYASAAAINHFGDNLITRARAANNVREVDGPTAKEIAKKALERLGCVESPDVSVSRAKA